VDKNKALCIVDNYSKPNIITTMKKQSTTPHLEYRLYSFVHVHITPLQKGLQTAHVVGELFAFNTKGKKRRILDKWAGSHKTIIILNGGNTLNLETLTGRIARLGDALQLPYIHFKEDKATLNGSTTAVGIIVPNSIYTMNLLTADDGDYPERELNKLLSEHKLAI
jgi:hypothetical protein